MLRKLLIALVALMGFAAVTLSEADARRGGGWHGGGWHGARGGGWHGARVGGWHGGRVWRGGYGWRGAGWRGPGWRGPGWRGGWYGPRWGYRPFYPRRFYGAGWGVPVGFYGGCTRVRWVPTPWGWQLRRVWVCGSPYW